ncbi:hypothetical protein Moror_15340 [Moniliophthora roreri MCA 2997]|uniref:Uncharacterized protein n=1 Tax=Moniliophthora roreri (strain MCA 2997) TaxID=1381753 RepID=V2WLT9_MONRO|nr:hypothetical protein Moror_15340 [Moniliophthora roreri MCA 2997]
MHFVLSTVLSLICVAKAITVTFPQNLVATQNNPFSWTLDESDPQDFDVRKQKLDDPRGLATFSTPIHVVANGSRTGNGTINFNRAGLFRVVVFDARDANLGQLLLSQTVTVFVAPTSAGASIPLTTGVTGFSIGSNQSISQNGESGGSNIPQSTKISNTSSSSNRTNVPPIVGFVLGSAGLIFLVTATLLWFRHQRRSQTKQDPPRNQELHVATDISPFHLETPFTWEKKRYPRPRNEETAHASIPAHSTERHNHPSETRSTVPQNTIGGRAEQLRRDGRFVYHNDSGWRFFMGVLRQAGTSTTSRSVVNVPPAYEAL